MIRGMLHLIFIAAIPLWSTLALAEEAEEVNVCAQQFLDQQESKTGDAICARSADEAQTSALRVAQAVFKNIGMDFDSYQASVERRCDCEFAYGRVDLTPRDSYTDHVGWLRSTCKQLVTNDGPLCGQKWFRSEENFKPGVCDPENPNHKKCVQGQFISEMKDPDSKEMKIVPLTICARKEPTFMPDGTIASKDALFLVVDAFSIPKYKTHINGCINVKIKKDLITKRISLSANAPNHSLSDVRNQEMLRGELIKKIVPQVDPQVSSKD